MEKGKMVIGFIGLGNMGNPMAMNLLDAGYELMVYDLERSNAENLIASGASFLEVKELSQKVDIIITSLPGPPQVEAVLLGEGGAYHGLRSGGVWIDMSTNSPELVTSIASKLQKKGVETLDAPVTGAVDGAKDGRLTIFVGGQRSVYERYKKIFDPLGKSIYTGLLGTGNVAKLVTNLLWFINAVAIGEALVLGSKAGIDLMALWTIIKESAGNSWVAEHDVPSIFRGDYDPSFSLNLCVKDLTLIHALGSHLSVPLTLGAVVEQIFRSAQIRYGGESGELHVVKLLEDITGVSLNVSEF